MSRWYVRHAGFYDLRSILAIYLPFQYFIQVFVKTEAQRAAYVELALQVYQETLTRTAASTQ